MKLVSAMKDRNELNLDRYFEQKKGSSPKPVPIYCLLLYFLPLVNNKLTPKPRTEFCQILVDMRSLNAFCARNFLRLEKSLQNEWGEVSEFRMKCNTRISSKKDLLRTLSPYQVQFETGILG